MASGTNLGSTSNYMIWPWPTHMEAHHACSFRVRDGSLVPLDQAPIARLQLVAFYPRAVGGIQTQRGVYPAA